MGCTSLPALWMMHPCKKKKKKKKRRARRCETTQCNTAELDLPRPTWRHPRVDRHTYGTWNKLWIILFRVPSGSLAKNDTLKFTPVLAATTHKYFGHCAHKGHKAHKGLQIANLPGLKRLLSMLCRSVQILFHAKSSRFQIWRYSLYMTFKHARQWRS